MTQFARLLNERQLEIRIDIACMPVEAVVVITAVVFVEITVATAVGAIVTIEEGILQQRQ